MLGTRIASIPYSLLRSGKPLGRSVYHLCGICYHTLHYLTSDASYPAYCTERVIEIPWILGRIRNLPRSTRILEVGCVLGQSLARLGYNVDTVDLSSSPTRDVPRWHIIREDICRLDAAGAYDAAVSISTLEHIGLGHYGDPVQPDGDRRAVERIAAALKPGGHLYVTTPFAERAGITYGGSPTRRRRVGFPLAFVARRPSRPPRRTAPFHRDTVSVLTPYLRVTRAWYPHSPGSAARISRPAARRRRSSSSLLSFGTYRRGIPIPEQEGTSNGINATGLRWESLVEALRWRSI